MAEGGFMRNYLTSFFDEFEYSAEDAWFFTDTYDKITADEKTNGLWREAIALYDKDINCDFRRIRDIADEVAEILYLEEYTAELLIFVCLSKRLRERYKEHGIDMEIYKSSMLDLKYKVDECKIVKGITGSFVAWWFDRFFDLKRFGIGRLQFEIIEFGEHYEKDGKVLTPESKVINVHIPRTLTPLDEKSCDEALCRAKEFFKDKVGENCAFVCDSWLLWPENKDILPPYTNIYKFMMRFDIIRARINKGKEDLWRLFDTDEKNYTRLPADTSARRAYIAHLKNGGKMGSGYGVFFA